MEYGKKLGLLFNNTPENLKNKFKKYERCMKKINLNYWLIEFNSTCLNEGIPPKYSKYYSFLWTYNFPKGSSPQFQKRKGSYGNVQLELT